MPSASSRPKASSSAWATQTPPVRMPMKRGSVIVVLATDVPFEHRQLRRLAMRAGDILLLPRGTPHVLHSGGKDVAPMLPTLIPGGVLPILALVPLALVAAALSWGARNRAQVLLLAFASWGLVASHLLFAHIVSFRYLHAFPWFVLANVSVIAWFTVRRWRGAHAPTATEFAGTPVP